MKTNAWMLTLAALLALSLTGVARAQYSSDPEKEVQHERDENLVPGQPLPPEVDDSAGPGPIQGSPGKVAIETLPAMTVIALPMTGSYDQHEKALRTLMEYVGPRGAVVQGPPFGIYYSDPTQISADSLQWEVCVPVVAGTKADGPFLVRDMGEMQAATVLCTGPFDKTATCYAALFDWAAQNGYTITGPAQEHWLSDPRTVKPEKRETRIAFPVARAAR
jgi:AraC family transcriptional regulator